MKKVLISGTFNILHQGHLNLFEQAKKYGDYLIAVVARDATVKKIKKPNFLNSEKQRLKCVQKCELISKALLGSSKNNPYQIIKKINPDTICLGYDQKAFTKNLPQELEKMSLKIKIRRMKPYQPEKFHSFIILNQKTQKK